MELFMTDFVGDSTGVCSLTSTFPADDRRGFGAEDLGGAVIGLVWEAGDLVLDLFTLDVLEDLVTVFDESETSWNEKHALYRIAL